MSGPRPSESKLGRKSKSYVVATNAATILTAVAKNSPALFRPHLAELCRVITSDFEEATTKNSAPGVLGVEIALMALANIVRWDSKLGVGLDKKTNERIVKLALGQHWRRAKFAARYLAFAKNSVELCTKVIEVCLTNLLYLALSDMSLCVVDS